MFCGECGARNPDTNQFCRNCGKPLGRRPVTAPVVLPAPVPGPALAPVAPAAAPAVPALQQTPSPAPAAARTRNWPGIISLVFGILSWGILTVFLAILAVVLGVVSLVWFRKATGKIGIPGILGIFLGIAAIAVLLMMA